MAHQERRQHPRPAKMPAHLLLLGRGQPDRRHRDDARAHPHGCNVMLLKAASSSASIPLWITKPARDAAVLAGLAANRPAHPFLRGVDEGTVESGSEIARKEGLHATTVNELLRLTRLVPSVVQVILAGQQPRTLSLISLKNHELPWSGAAPGGWF